MQMLCMAQHMDYHGSNEVTPLLSAAVPDMLEVQYELESKAAKWYTVGWKHSPTICQGLIQTALENGATPEHLQYINNIIVCGNTVAEVFEKGEKIIQILLEASFTIKKSKVEEPAREIQFLGVNENYRESEANYTPTEKGILADYGVQATSEVTEAMEGEDGSSQLAELKAVQLALDIAKREKWAKLYLYTDSWIVAKALGMTGEVEKG
ncbi:hypothetical protein DUI87_03123 [Hirundo rustica rustica]|uniref:Uncharacterized protein n=1 Tax=Hirundo rustica rustica TaxID=333673 RepID=A0A3M0L2A5_HIRRU|nr:hypothetical protein DUI87_03123 [Hirundo rustica rustica]